MPGVGFLLQEGKANGTRLAACLPWEDLELNGYMGPWKPDVDFDLIQ